MLTRKAIANPITEATEGKRLTGEQAHELAYASLPPLLGSAQELRAIGWGFVITYSPKVFIPVTRLCRDVCHYCTFARPPRRGVRAYMTRNEVLEIARTAAVAGCHEALFTLGDKPELRYRVAREELKMLGCESSIEYLVQLCELVLEETGLLPHVNPGVMTREELARLREVSPSQGMMLETTAARLGEPGGPHFGSPDKDPAARLATIETAGELSVPFTTGLLVGIGESRAERIETLLEIRRLHECHGHIQEVIVQNFRAKVDTKMAGHPPPPIDELLWTAAVARLVLGSEMSVQCPPNLSYGDFPRLLDAGINDWGGVSPVTVDHVNPEAPWPEIESLVRSTRSRGLELAPRLAVYPRYLAERERWLDPAVRPHVLRRADGDGLARDASWVAGESKNAPRLAPRRTAQRPTPPTATVLAKVAEGVDLDEDDVAVLFQARGRDLTQVFDVADGLRREVCGNNVSYVVTRNINYTNVCYFRCGFCAFSKGKLTENLRGAPYFVPMEEIVRRCREAWDRGAVEVCLQGGIHPTFTGDFYLDVCKAINSELPDLHLHAFSALEVWQGAATLGIPLASYLGQLRDAGLASLPGTAAEILDDEIRQLICPDKISTEQWLEVHGLAHEAGLRSTTTVMYGHTEGPRNWARHLIALREQQKRSGGFTEFVPLPFVHMEAPMYLRGRARKGPTFREAILMHAVGRIALHPWITNVQASWVKLGMAGAQVALRCGVNDLGGTLMNESISRAAGAVHGQEAPPMRLERVIRSVGRTPVQRTTLYGAPEADRVRRSFGAQPLAKPLNPPVREAGLVAPQRVLRPAEPETTESPQPDRAPPRSVETRRGGGGAER
ncbi:MAG: 5-amino-6-(D-ribitylamino)uracil--L-tyrosine 4-hydroxyphenyl transferase CofH [Solirubrobacterales bacterium]